MPSRPLLIAAGFACIAGAVSAQTAPEIHLARPTGIGATEFTKVIAAHELAPGKLLVGDESERKLVLLDFTDGSARPIGRIGAGPGEFRSIASIMPRRGGGAYVYDFALKRLLPVQADGTLGDPITHRGSLLHLHSADDAGRLYAAAMIFRNRELSDSMHVIRWDLASQRIDTVLTYDAGRSGMIIPPGQKFRVWYPTTSWTSLADGSLVFVEAANYRLSRWTRDVIKPVAALPFTPRQVTQADRDAYLDRRRNEKPIAIGQAGASGAAAPPRPDVAFPATYPAFEADTPLLRAPDGSLWIARLGSPKDSMPLVDVVTPQGKLVASIRLPHRSRLLAFGRNAIYLVERDSDDVERVRRFAYPSFPRP